VVVVIHVVAHVAVGVAASLVAEVVGVGAAHPLCKVGVPHLHLGIPLPDQGVAVAPNHNALRILAGARTC
jgi:hypothetical protein